MHFQDKISKHKYDVFKQVTALSLFKKLKQISDECAFVFLIFKYVCLFYYNLLFGYVCIYFYKIDNAFFSSFFNVTYIAKLIWNHYLLILTLINTLIIAFPFLSFQKKNNKHNDL